MDPITRKEMFLARAGGQDVETPEPITREETFLQEIVDNIESGGGGASGGDRPLPIGSAGKYVGYNSSGTGVAITPDSTPTDGSNKLVTSNGVYGALAAKQDKLTFDPAPTENSPNALTSGAVYAALDNLPSGGGEGLSSAAKEALLALLEKVAYIDENGADYLEDLEDALYELNSISCVFTQGSMVVYDSTPLDDLKPGLVVTAHYKSGETKAVTNYTLSGTLVGGTTSTVTVTYKGKTATFSVNVAAAPVLQSISAVYNGGDVAMGSDVNALKTDLVVTATYTDSSTETVPSTDYTLSGNLSTVGSKTITVSYQNKTTTFNVTVVEMQLEAVFSGTDVLTSTPLNDLKTDLVVTLYEGSTSEVIPSADYTLSGTLTKGTSVVDVSYSGITTTFTISNVTLDTTAKIAGSGILSWASGAPKVTTMTNGCYTTMCDAGESSQVNYVAGIVPTQGTVLVNNGANMVFYQNDATESDVTTKAYDHVNMNTLSGGNASSGYNRWAQYQGGTMTEWTGTWTDAYQKLRLCLDSRYLDRAYLIDKNTGKVFFAGRNTPYWGMENISEASA